MTATNTPHVLVITGSAEDGDRHYEIECPGVTDACRMWQACDCPESAGGMDAPLWEDELAHGVEHRNIDGDWMTATDACFVSTTDSLCESADDLALQENLEPGQYPVTFDYQGEGYYVLDLIKSAQAVAR